MERLLLTADWHIADYPDYNFSDKSRLNQFLKLSDRIIELSKLEDAETLVIAGDLVDVPTMSPVVLHVVKNVIDKLKSHFSKIYYILGQHDLATKSKSQNIDDTAVSLFDSSNMIYMNHKIITIDDCKIGFQNWTKDQDTSWINEHLDFLIGHYTKSKLFGQVIDESKFDYMIHGDIHNDQEIDKFISIGNPIQKDMSSMGNGSIIILDPSTKSFKRVRTDEDHTRFLRIDYTDKEELDGFLNPLQYYIYKPKYVKESTSTPEVSKTDNLNSIVSKYLKESKLVDIHNECFTKCKSYRSIDFNFQVTNVKIHGYRSIVDFSIDFQKDDRVLFLGNNGSGKSSIMNAINDLFTKNRHLKDFLSDFTDDMLLEVTIQYQNKVYVIRKGNDWGLSIDGNQVGYNNKSEFEDDLIQRLPFLQYSDLFFIGSNISNLSNQLNVDRKVELITRFFGFDKLGALSDTAQSMIDELETEIYNDKLSIKDKESKKSYIDASIKQIPDDLKTLKEESLLEEKERLSQLRDKKSAYDSWIKQKESINKEIEIYNKTLTDKQKFMTINIDDLLAKKSKVDEALKKNSDELLENNQKWNQWVTLHQELNKLLETGKELKYKYDELSKRVCPTCHRPLNDTPEHNHIIKQVDSELYKVRELYKERKKNYDSVIGLTKVDERYYMDKSESILEKKNTLVTYKSDIQTKINLYESAKDEIDKYTSEINKLKDRLKELEGLDIPQVELPEDINDLETELLYKLNQVRTYNQYVSDLNNLDNEIKEITESIEPKKLKISRLGEYALLIGRTGKILEAILNQLAEKFSNEKIMYKVNSGISRGKQWILFDSYFKVKNKYRNYASLSDGQKNISDLDFLSKLFSSRRVGLLVLDEYVKHLDESNSLLASEILGKMNVNTLLISTHSSNYPIFTKKVFLELGTDGKTKNTII